MTDPRSPLLSLAAFDVVGLSLRTHNDEATTTIPALWARAQTLVLDRRPADALVEPGACVAVYTDYESDQRGPYTLLVGVPVPPAHVPAAGLEKRHVPAARYAPYDVLEPGPAGIFGAWQRVWDDPAARAFTTDLEIYPAGGALPRLLIAR